MIIADFHRKKNRNSHIKMDCFFFSELFNGIDVRIRFETVDINIAINNNELAISFANLSKQINVN